ncbi:acetate/propionate family kinase [uncultured Thomasclavelia sp.]|uniref:acetate/propionate family kinase n=1 Tax=uncultured Thomasclavelia sp. TaxID=3025759 RepID=UPI0025D3B885|nr:acetate kinase [uncultured Thomasclavelia sp.]
MAKVISVNAGSSSLKFQLFEMDDESVITSGVIERIGLDDSIFTIKYNGEKDVTTKPIKDHKEAVNLLLETLVSKQIVKDLNEIKGVGHRVVQGGAYFDQSVIIDDDVVAKIDELKSLAPLHNPAHLTGYYAFKEAIPDAGAVAVFDTAFHQTLEPRCYIYPIPYKYYTDYKVRKYGAHGTSHYYVSQRAIDLLGNPEHSKIIVAHLGAGGSLTAVKDGKSVNTSMGFTPLAGIMMGTRSGDVDPSVIDYLIEEVGMDMKEVITMLNKESGLLGISGVSSDFRDVQEAAQNGHERAQLAIDIFFRRVIAYIGRYYIALGGCDAICFTAGIGENSYYARSGICDLLKEALGVELDEEANVNGKGERLISTPNSKIKVFVIPTNEELVIARDTKRLLNL